MGIFSSLFPKKKTTTNPAVLKAYFETLNGYIPTFTSFGGGIYEADITRAAIHAFATQCSKLKPELSGASKNVPLERILQYKPNPWQNTAQFLYQVATLYKCNNNVFVVPIYDDYYQNIVGLYPVSAQQVTIKEGPKGEPWVVYMFNGGQTGAIEMKNCAILTQFQKDDFFGADNSPLLPTLQMIHTQNEGIIEGIKNSATIRFIAQLNTVLKSQDIEAERKRLTESNFAPDNNGGVMMIDSKYKDIKQIDSKPFIVNAEEMRIINENVFNYLGVSQHIIQNNWTEQEYNAFYEGAIEPFALQLGLALTNLFFTERELAFGNSVQFSANRLQYASIDTKLRVAKQMLDRGLLTRNEVREIFQLPPVDDGDKFVIRGEYVAAEQQLDQAEVAEEQELEDDLNAD